MGSKLVVMININMTKNRFPLCYDHSFLLIKDLKIFGFFFCLFDFLKYTAFYLIYV